jgi:glycosyltransferase involved in cell wall biosynthesis
VAGGRITLAARRALVRNAGLIFVHADALRDELIELERPRAPIDVIPHGVADPVVEPLPTRPALLFFGRLSYYKGLDTLFDAMQTVWEARPDVRLIVAGSGQLDPHPAMDDERVEMHHRHIAEEELPELFGRATCVVLPYRQASQSGVGSLAKRFGRGLVATSVGGLPELVGDDAGLLVPPEDRAALAGALLEMVQSPERAAAYGAAAADSVVRESSWRRVAERTLAAYDRALPLSGA